MKEPPMEQVKLNHGISAPTSLESWGEYECTVLPISGHLLNGYWRWPNDDRFLPIGAWCATVVSSPNGCLRRGLEQTLSCETLQTILYNIIHKMVNNDPIVELPQTLPTSTDAVVEWKMVS